MRKEYEDFISVIRETVFSIGTTDLSATELNNLKSLFLSHKMYTIYMAYIKKRFAKTSQYGDILAYRHLMQKNEYKKLCAELEKKSIRYMPLKGIAISDIYPEGIIREMTDIDIYADKENFEIIKDIFLKNGYIFEHRGHHDVYVRNDISVCFEIHETIVDKQRDTKTDEFFKNPCMLAKKSGFCYRLTSENELIYLIAHYFGHFHQGGAGVRGVLDIYLYEKCFDIDNKYVDEILERYKLKDFYDNIRQLGKVWFENKKIDTLSNELGEYIISSGAFGITERLNLDLSSCNKSRAENIKLMLRRKLFLPQNEIIRRYPWAKTKMLLPIAYAKRVVSVIKNNRNEIADWYTGFKGANTKRISEQKKRMKRFGA